MELIKKHIEDDSDTGLLGFDCTVRLSGHEIDLIRLALSIFADHKHFPDKMDLGDAQALYDEFTIKC